MSLEPFLTTLGELSATHEQIVTLYRQGENSLADWEQLGLYLTILTELTSDLRDQALKLHLIPVSRLCSQVVEEGGWIGHCEFNGSEPELSSDTAAQLVSLLAEVINLLGWAASAPPGAEKTFHFQADRKEDLITLLVRPVEGLTAGGLRPTLPAEEQLKPVGNKFGELHGRFEVDQSGTWFRVTVPVFPSLIRCVVFQKGAETYALPTRDYLYQLTVNRQEVRRSGDLTFILRYPEVIPLLSLGEIPPIGPEEQDVTVMMIGADRRRYGLPVTSVVGVEELIRIKDVGQGSHLHPLPHSGIFSGQALRRDGTKVPLIEAGNLIPEH